ncbi:MAG: DNA recombination protein RmuC, partial [Limisphaerales bacterium]
MDPLLYLLLGVVLGGVIGWLLGARFRGERDDGPLASTNLLEAELRQQLTHRDGELARTRAQLAEAGAGLAATEARQHAAEKHIEEIREELRQREAELGDTNTKLVQTGHQLSGVQAQLQAAGKLLTDHREMHERQLLEAKATQEKALADLREAFKALSADALKQTQPEFLRLANETLGKFAESAKGDLSQRQEAIATLVKPLEEQLKTYQQRLAQSETTQSTALGEVKKHLESLAQHSQTLSTETLQLRRVLSSNQARGRW